MNFWQFLDKQIGRMTSTAVAGAGIFALTGVVLAMLAYDKELADNDLFKTLSQAIVVQGLIGLAMAAWFTRKTGDDVQDVHVTNSKDDPAQTEDVGA